MAAADKSVLIPAATMEQHGPHVPCDVDNLIVGHISVDQGPSMWRIRPRAQGRATWIQRKTSHVSVILKEV